MLMLFLVYHLFFYAISVNLYNFLMKYIVRLKNNTYFCFCIYADGKERL